VILTKKQEEGLKIAVARHRAHEKYTVIAGYAGTGKSTLVKFIIEALDVDHSKVCYATFTGKAAQVLAKKGNKNAMTLHKLLFDSIPRKGGGFMRIPKKTLDYTVVVVDEISMAPKSIIDKLFQHNVYVICLGDPFQLPPIDKEEDNHLLDHPHIFLDEIMRQAEESEIIRLTMGIRDQKPLNFAKGNEVQILPYSELCDGMLNWADQVLVATNLQRHSMNDFMRQMRGFGPDPCDGDKVICLRNYWDSWNYDNGDPLVNGTIGTIHNPRKDIIRVPYYAYNKGVIHTLQADFTTDVDEHFGEVSMDPKIMLGGESELEWRDKYRLGQLKNRIGDVIPKEFTYGYAITCHKAQGSEWDKVLVIEEKFPFQKIDHARWLYTAATRAAEKLVIITKE
jgi:exodeoxyribonuclease-5